MIPDTENVSPVIYSGEQSVLTCGILTFREYWLKDRWSEEAIRRIEEGRKGKGRLWWTCTPLIIMPRTTLTTASTLHADLYTVKWNYFRSYSSTVSVLFTSFRFLFVAICCYHVAGLALHLHQYTHDCTPLMGGALSQWAQGDTIMAYMHKHTKFFTMCPSIFLVQDVDWCQGRTAEYSKLGYLQLLQTPPFLLRLVLHNVMKHTCTWGSSGQAR